MISIFSDMSTHPDMCDKIAVDIGKQENDQSYERKNESGIQTAESGMLTSIEKTTGDETDFSESLLWDPPKVAVPAVSAWDPNEGEVSNPSFLMDDQIQSSNIEHRNGNHFGDISTIEHDQKMPSLAKG